MHLDPPRYRIKMAIYICRVLVIISEASIYCISTDYIDYNPIITLYTSYDAILGHHDFPPDFPMYADGDKSTREQHPIAGVNEWSGSFKSR